MGNPSKKINDNDYSDQLKAINDREQWQKEFIARQDFVKTQVEQRKQLRKVPKAAWIFMAIWGGVFAFSIMLFLMSFNPTTKPLVSKILGAFSVF